MKPTSNGDDCGNTRQFFMYCLWCEVCIPEEPKLVVFVVVVVVTVTIFKTADDYVQESEQ
jgi:hypothetical protein